MQPLIISFSARRCARRNKLHSQIDAGFEMEWIKCAYKIFNELGHAPDLAGHTRS